MIDIEANPDLERVVDAYTDLKMKEPYGSVVELSGKDAANVTSGEIYDIAGNYDSAECRTERSLKAMIRNDADTMLGRAWKHFTGYIHLSKEEREMKGVLNETVARKYGDVEDRIGGTIEKRYGFVSDGIESGEKLYDELTDRLCATKKELKEIKGSIKETAKELYGLEHDLNLYSSARSKYERTRDPKGSEGYEAIVHDIERTEGAIRDVAAELGGYKAKRDDLKGTIKEVKKERSDTFDELVTWRHESNELELMYFFRYNRDVGAEEKPEQ